jgi:hypothetical protein
MARVGRDPRHALLSTFCPAYCTLTRFGGFGDHAHGMRDQHQGHARVALQRHQQIEDLRLDGDVERGGRLVGDQQRGLQASAMAIITRWLMPPESWCG